MNPRIPEPLAGAEIHGFHTTSDLDVEKLMEDASSRWLRPNEVHAMLSNYTRFKIQPQPVDTPQSGTLLFFDRKMLRNFRKDGHNWKKKKDGKTVQEAHEKLKIGNEERIHVYYARSEDDPNFYRRCYWLLDKNLERIVLVHYRHTGEENEIQPSAVVMECTDGLAVADMIDQGSPKAPMNSAAGSYQSEMSPSSVVFSEELASNVEYGVNSDSGKAPRAKDGEIGTYQLRLHEINTLEWSDLLVEPASVDFTIRRGGDISSFDQNLEWESRADINEGCSMSSSHKTVQESSFEQLICGGTQNDGNGGRQTNCHYKDDSQDQPLFPYYSHPSSEVACSNLESVNHKDYQESYTSDHFRCEKHFGQTSFIDGPISSFGTLQVENSNAKCDLSSSQPIFTITDISPSWGSSTEETKVLIVGCFDDFYKHLVSSSVYCVIGGECVPTEMVQVGVYRCMALPHTPGLVNIYLTIDGNTPISQILSFNYRIATSNKLNGEAVSSESSISSSLDVDSNQLHVCRAQTRLLLLLFSTSSITSLISDRVTPNNLREAKKFASLTSPLIDKDWMSLPKCKANKLSSLPSYQVMLKLILKSKLQEWLLAKVAEGCRTTPHDSEGQGVIHLCAILDYSWAVSLFKLSGMSLDFRDASGWTALHWAAYFGREKMVAALLSAGANPSLVTDPTPESPGGSTAADLASKQGHEGLAAYLAEKGLAAHFQAMTLSGNITGPTPPDPGFQASFESLHHHNLTEQELCLKESLAAYRNAADAADRIQAAFRERYLKLQTREVQLVSPEIEANNIVAALKIQHAFRNYNRRKMMKAAARIQGHFRTWKTRKDFLNMRRQAIKIQAAFRGHLIRKQYRKIIWSVGVLEKAVLRWRLKRKGLRGIQGGQIESMRIDREEENTVEEDFYRISREQAEERVKRSVIRVQAMFRSYKAQQEYRRIKLAHEKAKLEFNQLVDSNEDL